LGRAFIYHAFPSIASHACQWWLSHTGECARPVEARQLGQEAVLLCHCGSRPAVMRHASSDLDWGREPGRISHQTVPDNAA